MEGNNKWSIQPEYGYVMLVFVLSIIQLTWMASRVVNARKKFNVKYPDMYSEKSDIFNCIQRVHLNTLEYYTSFLGLMFIGGLKHPCPAAIGGLVWIIGRFVYALGYYTGDPEKRKYGSIGLVGILVLFGTVISGALSQLGVL